MDFFGITEDYRDHQFRYIELFDKIYSSGKLYDGIYTEELEDKFAYYCGSRYAVAVGSGSDALMMVLKFLGFNEFVEEVLIPNYTYVATMESVYRAGATPIPGEVYESGPEKYMLDCGIIRRNYRVMVYVPLFGLSGNMDKVVNYCGLTDMLLIEDCAQSIGTLWDGKHVGTFGVAGTFSFDPTKVLASPDGGGMVITNNEVLARHVRKMRYHGLGNHGMATMTGMNSRMSEIGAAIISYKMDFLNTTLALRTSIANRYTNCLGQIPQVKCPEISLKLTPSWSKYVIEVPKEERTSLINFLEGKGIPTKIHYERTPFSVYAGDVELMKKYPSYKLTQTSLSLPIHPYLAKNDFQAVDQVCNAIGDFFK